MCSIIVLTPLLGLALLINPLFMEEYQLTNLHWSDPGYIAGNFEPGLHAEFVKIDSAFTESEKYLHKEAYSSFLQMALEAKKAGVYLTIISACRNFETQKKLWEDKWEGRTKIMDRLPADPVLKALRIMEYTAPPGLSRHHWGTEIDLNSVEPSYFKTRVGIKTYVWLSNHAHEFGYCQTYTRKNSDRPLGFEEEKWHWSYTPISTQIWEQQIRQFRPQSYKPFLGEQAVYSLPILEQFIKMVNQ